jgi:hypothetical protein
LAAETKPFPNSVLSAREKVTIGGLKDETEMVFNRTNHQDSEGSTVREHGKRSLP